MAGPDSDQERSLEPSERRLQKAREDGRFAQSRDLSLLIQLAVAVLAAALGGASLWQAARTMVASALQLPPGVDALDHLARWSAGPLLSFALWLLAYLLLAAVAGVLGPLVLAGMRPVFAPRFDLGRLDPLAGLGRMFAARNLFTLGKGVAVMAAVVGVGAAYLLARRDGLVLPATAALPAALQHLGATLAGGLQWLCLVVLVVAVADAAFQWFSFRRDLRMTLQDVKDESKESEGSPEIRARLRSLQREASRRRMMSAVERADVVVVNPTHFAVALRYDAARMEAPVVVAKGTDEVALRMRALAERHGVPLAESPLLARWLSAHVELDASVPVRLYPVIAQLLAWAHASRAGEASSAMLPPLDASLPPPD